MTAAAQDAFVRAVDTSPVYALARETALQHAPGLSAGGAPDVWLKREDQQPWFSFKIRGAVHAVAALAPEVRQRGVVAASAGNHAQGLAAAARHFGVTASIVMPRATPAIKVSAVRALGAHVRLVGDTFADAERTAAHLAATRGLTLVHPFDDPRVIEGQATIAAEILRQHAGPIDAIVVPVGGGGLIAGIAAYVKARRPGVRVIGVEPIDSDALYRALRAGRPVPVASPGRFADGVAVRQVGRHVFPLAVAGVDQVVRVSRAEICDAMRRIFEETRAIVEPAGALGVAGLGRLAASRRGPVVAVLTGANVDFDRLAEVARRSAPRGGRATDAHRGQRRVPEAAAVSCAR